LQSFQVADVRWETGITESNSGLRIAGASAAGPDFQLAIGGPPGLAFAIQTSTNLLGWTTLSQGVLGDALFEFVHTNALLAPKTFYRAVGSP
jgi:hypothetical protein